MVSGANAATTPRWITSVKSEENQETELVEHTWNLPNEIAVISLTKLAEKRTMQETAKDIASFGCVCKYFNALAKVDSLWKYVCQLQIPPASLDHLLIFDATFRGIFKRYYISKLRQDLEYLLQPLHIKCKPLETSGADFIHIIEKAVHFTLYQKTYSLLDISFETISASQVKKRLVQHETQIPFEELEASFQKIRKTIEKLPEMNDEELEELSKRHEEECNKLIDHLLCIERGHPKLFKELFPNT
jgi:hypothetical protein